MFFITNFFVSNLLKELSGHRQLTSLWEDNFFNWFIFFIERSETNVNAHLLCGRQGIVVEAVKLGSLEMHLRGPLGFIIRIIWRKEIHSRQLVATIHKKGLWQMSQACCICHRNQPQQTSYLPYRPQFRDHLGAICNICTRLQDNTLNWTTSKEL